MNTDFLCEKRLSELNPFYNTLVKNTAFVLCHALDQYKHFFPDFTDHTILHSIQVLDFCNRLIAENIDYLNADELYVLIMGAYLHDCGMGISIEDYQKLSETVVSDEYRLSHTHDNIRETVRGFHQLFSKQLIIKYADLFEIPSPEHIQAIAYISEGHRKTDLFDESIIPTTITVPNGNQLHLPYLASLIRLADELDIAADRNIGIFEDNTDTIFKMMHRSVRCLHILPDTIRLDVETSDPALFDDIKKELSKLEHTLQLCGEVCAKRSPFQIRQKSLTISRINSKGKHITVLDSDLGTDDAIAILLLKNLPQKPDYIVSSFGNTTLENAVRNAILLKKRLGLSTKIVSGLPIPPDPNLPITEKNTFHGLDGLAGCAADMIKTLGITEEDLSDYIPFPVFRQELSQVDSITYITIGSLTNLSDLLEDSSLRTKLSGLYVMGGGLNEFNCNNQTEFNFSKNPKAVKNLLSLGVNITLFPLDITNHQTLSDNDIDRLEAIGSYPEFIRFLRHNRNANAQYNGIPAAVLHDTLPVLYVSHPEYFVLKDMRIASNQVGHTMLSPEAKAIHVCVGLKEGILFREIEKAFLHGKKPE